VGEPRSPILTPSSFVQYYVQFSDFEAEPGQRIPSFSNFLFADRVQFPVRRVLAGGLCGYLSKCRGRRGLSSVWRGSR